MRIYLLLSFILIGLCSNSQQLYIASGSHFVSNGAPVLVAHNASINNNGIIHAGNSTFQFSGNADTSLSFINGGGSSQLYNLTISKASYGVALKSAVGVQNVLTLNNGNLYADSNLTLISTASNTARVAVVPPTCNIFGKANVERYFPARRAWRLLTAPVTSSNSIYNCWQNGGVYTVGRGTLITNPVVANGIDVASAPSLKAWNPATQGLSVVTNTYTNISPGNNGSADNTGYFLFVRGDRNPILTNGTANCNSTTLSCTGKLQTGTQTFTCSSNINAYTLIGNPFASPIDFNNVSRTNIVKRFWVWDPNLNVVGGYVMLDDIDGDGVFTKNVSGSTMTKDIQSSQAFFIQTASNGPASISIPESAKSTNNLSSVFRTPGLPERMNANLYIVNNDGTTTLADGTLVEFKDSYSPAVNFAEDAVKFGNVNEQLGFYRDGFNLSVERRPYISENDTLFFKLTKTSPIQYQFELVAENMDYPNLNGFLVDKYMNSMSPISLNGTSVIQFSVDGSTGSTAFDRFMIIFKKSVLLPVSFTSVNAILQDKNIKVEWNVENELNIDSYDIEQSSDGRIFTFAATQMANGGRTPYNWLDIHPFTGDNYFRIKSKDKNGTIKYSEIVKVKMSEAAVSSIKILPNHGSDGVLNLQMNNMPKGEYNVRLFNSSGQMLLIKKLNHDIGNSVEIISIGKTLPAGSYKFEVIRPDNTITTLSFVYL